MAAGHVVVDPREGDVLLIDHDVPFGPYPGLLARHNRAFLYPHGANPIFSADGIHPVHEKTRGQFVIGEGHQQILDTFYPLPTAMTGWPFGPVLPFRPGEPRRVLYAATHALGDGRIGDAEARVNQETHARLADLPIELTVRHVGPLDHSRLQPLAGVIYQQAEHHDLAASIDAADVAVSAGGSFPYIAASRGCPLVMVGQDDWPVDHIPGGTRRAATWDLYRDLYRYPHDGDGDLLVHLERACVDDVPDWRKRFIGDPMDPAEFAAQFERAVTEW